MSEMGVSPALSCLPYECRLLRYLLLAVCLETVFRLFTEEPFFEDAFLVGQDVKHGCPAATKVGSPPACPSALQPIPGVSGTRASSEDTLKSVHNICMVSLFNLVSFLNLYIV